MASLLSWVDYSSCHRDDMDKLLDAFWDKGTVDELGIGTIRDALSNTPIASSLPFASSDHDLHRTHHPGVLTL